MVQRKTFKMWFKNRSMCRRKYVIIYVFIVFILIILLHNLENANIRKIDVPMGSPDAKHADTAADVTSRSVWPEELPFGDRIREQMSYVPKGYKYDATPMKRILIHTGLGNDWERPKLDRGEFVGCAVSQCWLTVDKSLGPEVDAVLFRHTYSRPEYKRPPNQIWILEVTEPPPRAVAHVSDPNVINWTATYRWDSELLRPYGYFMEHKPPLPRKPVDYYYPRTKTKKVAWFVSNCHSNSMREVYAAELAKHIDVDVYGHCGKLKCPRSEAERCFKMLDTDYKFYLSFENARCSHYITEKFFMNALGHNVVPIVMGPSRDDYELVAPKHSFIHVHDYDSAEQLAAYLHELDQDDELYEQYFRWKDTGTITNETGFYCRLCALLHDQHPPAKSYEDFNEWWDGEDVCDSGPFRWNVSK